MGRACTTRWSSAKCMQNTRRETAGKNCLGIRRHEWERSVDMCIQ